MTPRRVVSLAAAAVLATATAAQASLLITPNGAAGANPTVEASTPYPTSIYGYEDGATLTALDTGTYLFTFDGAGDPSSTNTFAVTSPGCPVSFEVNGAHPTSPGTSVACTLTAGQTIDFTFTSSIAGGSLSSGSRTAIAGLDYLLGMPGSTSAAPVTTGATAYIGLSDGGSATDHDFQDLVLRVSEIPEPDSVAVMAAALLGLGIARARRRRSPARVTTGR
jgi:hypothetical protein